MNLATALMDYAARKGRDVSPILDAIAQGRQARAQQPPAPRISQASQSAPSGLVPQVAPNYKGPDMMLPLHWKGTHRTDNAPWNTQGATAIDIMGHPGEFVRTPVAGTITRQGSAQGGASLYLDDDDPDRNPDYWLGHISNTLKVGTHVRRGQRIARISPDHPRPHAHWDRIGG